MSDGSLSQDEIDALLQETDNLEIDTGGGLEGLLGEKERGQFLRLLEGLVGAQASNLSILTRKSVNLDKPTLQVVSGEDLSASLPAELVDVKIDFSEGLRGEHSYLLDLGTAQAIAGLMMGQAGVEMDDAALSAVAEALSQMSGPVASEIGNQISRTVKTAPPDFQRASRDQARFPQGEAIVKVEYPILVEGQAPSRLTELYSLALVKEIAGSLPAAGQPAAAAGLAASFAQGARAQGAAPAAARGLGAPPSGAGMTFGQSFGSAGNPAVPPNVQPVQFANLQGGGLPAESGNIGLLMDVFMELTVELGRTRKLIREILGIGEGTIIELDKLAGEPVDILVNHKLIAKGEVVVIDENFGVRVTEIVSPMQRMGDLT
ncbi:MAG: flagellar motor switch protein FliN [Spirochaetes bacterium RBG_16_67_19]|nr:MAG: flagellar motor switch protein FliN [Spirochaetes bacterium RBG_16_67_19]